MSHRPKKGNSRASGHVVQAGETGSIDRQPMPPTTADSHSPTSPPKTRFLLMMAVATAALWWVALLLVALLTANPVTLNLVQIQQADLIVQATVIDRDAQTVTVETQWKSDLSQKTPMIERLAEAGAASGSTYLIPVERRARRLAVAAAPLKDRKEGAANRGRPIIYPATPEALAQLERILAGS